MTVRCNGAQQHDAHQSQQSNYFTSAPTRMDQEQQTSYVTWSYLEAAETLNRLQPPRDGQSDSHERGDVGAEIYVEWWGQRAKMDEPIVPLFQAVP